jgi:hypothetical protein
VTPSRIVILDNEAVQALQSVGHPHHRRTLAHIQVVAQRKRKALPVDLVAPTAVRVEAGWDRTAPAAAFVNRLRIRDAALDGPAANVAAGIRARHEVSVANAHLGAVVAALAPKGAVTVITSDPADVGKVVQPYPVTIATL